MKTKGERLQLIMSEYELSNVDVANITGLSKAFISDIKLGKKMQILAVSKPTSKA